MKEDNTNTIIHLKEILLEQIKGQERVQLLFKKILRRITIVTIGLSFSILGGIIFIIYTENKPQSAINKALKSIEGLETRIRLQRTYINMNTEKLQDIDTTLNNDINHDKANIK